MSKRRKKPKPPAPSRFKVGDCVRVKPSFRDEEHPDIPLGGWAGTVSEIHRSGIHTIRWSRETLASIHPIYKKRCAIDGTVLEEYWLGDDDLEPDPGGPLSIEQPTTITPRPLSADKQGDRVRMVFGLTSDDFLPDVDDDSLETYYDHLVEQMSLPVKARHCPQEEFLNPSPLRRVTVVALDREVAWEEDEGILCEIRTADGEEVVPLTDLELRRSDPNYQLVDDFTAWFVGELSEDDVDDDDDEESEDDEEDTELPEEAAWRSAASTLLEITAFATSFGAVVGAAVAVMPWARWAAGIGGSMWGVFVAVAQVRYAEKDRRFVVLRFQKVADGIIGLFTGAVQGAFFGIMAVAFIGAILGGIVGLVLRRLVRGRRWLVLHIFPKGVLFAAACGVVAQVFYLNRAVATAGLWYGTVIGLGSGLFLSLVALPLAFVVVRRTSR